MYITEKSILPVMAGGLVLGLLADLLLRSTPWGFNILLWVLAFMTIAAWLSQQYDYYIPRHVRYLALPALFIAASFVWRDSDTLKIINGVALCSIFSLAAQRRTSVNLVVGRISEYTLSLVQEWLAAPFTWLQSSKIGFLSLNNSATGIIGTPLAIIRGILISIPLLLLFGTLFARADASFERLVASLLEFDLSAMYSMLLWFPICSLIGGGILLRIMLERENSGIGHDRSRVAMGIIETGIVLGVLNLLFFGFIVSQLGYFFGGSAVLVNTQGLSAATYARRGFFELSAVSLLVLPLLLTMHWVLNEESAKFVRIFKVLSGALVMMLFVIMASAMHRMYLYQHNFGLTELRLYTSSFMVWLALVFVWFLKTVLFEKRERFTFGALASGFIIITLLDFANPDALIVRMNTARSADSSFIDTNYLATLSSDAVPALIEALPKLDDSGRRMIISTLEWRMESIQSRDWRSWNLSGQIGRHQVKYRLAGMAQ